MKMGGKRKITDLEQVQLLTMHAVGFKKEAQDYALSLGCTKHYGAMLCHKMQERLFNPPRRERDRLKWERAKAAGSIII